MNLPGVKDTFQQFPDHPVVNVTWYNAVDFCNWLSDISSVPRAYDEQYRLINMAGIRLPLESEWERAATLASGIYPWGTESPFPELANFGVEKVEADTKNHIHNRLPVTHPHRADFTTSLEMSGNGAATGTRKHRGSMQSTLK